MHHSAIQIDKYEQERNDDLQKLSIKVLICIIVTCLILFILNFGIPIKVLALLLFSTLGTFGTVIAIIYCVKFVDENWTGNQEPNYDPEKGQGNFILREMKQNLYQSVATHETEIPLISEGDHTRQPMRGNQGSIPANDGTRYSAAVPSLIDHRKLLDSTAGNRPASAVSITPSATNRPASVVSIGPLATNFPSAEEEEGSGVDGEWSPVRLSRTGDRPTPIEPRPSNGSGYGAPQNSHEDLDRRSNVSVTIVSRMPDPNANQSEPIQAVPSAPPGESQTPSGSEEPIVCGKYGSEPAAQANADIEATSSTNESAEKSSDENRGISPPSGFSDAYAQTSDEDLSSGQSGRSMSSSDLADRSEALLRPRDSNRKSINKVSFQDLPPFPHPGTDRESEGSISLGRSRGRGARKRQREQLRRSLLSDPTLRRNRQSILVDEVPPRPLQAVVRRSSTVLLSGNNKNRKKKKKPK